MKRLAVLAISLVLTNTLWGQDATSFNITFNHLAISVKDVNRSAEFYKKVLNLPEIENRGKMEGVRWFATGDGKELHLVSILKDQVVLNKAIHIAFTTSNFDAFIASLNAMNIQYSDWPGTAQKINIRADGTKQVFFQDVDGCWIEVNSLGQK